MNTKNITVICVICVICIILLICIFKIFKGQVNEFFQSSNKKKKLIKKKRDIYTDILKKTVNACNKLNIPCFISSGTCLGYHRDGNFIEYDYDIDIGIFAEDYDPKIIKYMINEGFRHYRTLGNKHTGLELSFILPNTSIGKYAKVDIFTHHLEKDKNNNNYYYYWISYKYPKFVKRIKYRVPVFNIIPINFNNVSVHIPYPTEDYLKNHYGDDWKTPKRPFKEYNYMKSPISIVK